MLQHCGWVLVYVREAHRDPLDYVLFYYEFMTQRKAGRKSRTKTMATQTQGGGRVGRPKNAMRTALATLTENAKQDQKSASECFV